MSTGISDIGSHPKDEERLKHHILWMLDAKATVDQLGKTTVIAQGNQQVLLVAAVISLRLLCRRRSNTIVASAVFSFAPTC